MWPSCQAAKVWSSVCAHVRIRIWIQVVSIPYVSLLELQAVAKRPIITLELPVYMSWREKQWTSLLLLTPIRPLWIFLVLVLKNHCSAKMHPKTPNTVGFFQFETKHVVLCTPLIITPNPLMNFHQRRNMCNKSKTGDLACSWTGGYTK